MNLASEQCVVIYPVGTVVEITSELRVSKNSFLKPGMLVTIIDHARDWKGWITYKVMIYGGHVAFVKRSHVKKNKYE